MGSHLDGGTAGEQTVNHQVAEVGGVDAQAGDALVDDQGGVGHLIGALGEAGVQRSGQLAGQVGEQLLQLLGGLGLGLNGVAAAQGGLQPGNAAAQEALLPAVGPGLRSQGRRIQLEQRSIRGDLPAELGVLAAGELEGGGIPAPGFLADGLLCLLPGHAGQVQGVVSHCQRGVGKNLPCAHPGTQGQVGANQEHQNCNDNDDGNLRAAGVVLFRYDALAIRIVCHDNHSNIPQNLRNQYTL